MEQQPQSDRVVSSISPGNELITHVTLIPNFVAAAPSSPTQSRFVKRRCETHYNLFSRIDQEQIKHADKELKYQCRCSFLEIYYEKITDLLDPTLKHLQIREDVKAGVYVENLTEICVSTRS